VSVRETLHVAILRVSLGWLRPSGFAPSLLWSITHFWFFTAYRNRLRVGTNWVWNYIRFARNARLITGLGGTAAPTIVTQTM
jgi:NADH:ubiquinone reductase (H+-translocating)